MQVKLLLVALCLLTWQSIAIISTLHSRLDAKATQLELLIQELEK